MNSKTENLLEVKNLKMHFPVHGGILQRQVGVVKAVDGISFIVKKGETLGLVGESGCGKSTTGKCIINLETPTAGEVLFTSENREFVNYLGAVDPMTQQLGVGKINLANLSNKTMRPFRSEIQMIFQDPYASLNPRMTVNDIIMEPLIIHKKDLSAKEREEKVSWLLEKVGLSAEQASRYPHEFSGGQRQRIGIARALATSPALVIADEPVSALDVSIQAQVINLMQDLQDEFGLTYIFIAHDLAVVEHISDRIAVMYLGNIVEIAKTDDLFNNPKHPYTKALLSAIPKPDPNLEKQQRQMLEGDVPTPRNKPSGCGFRTRCPIAQESCAANVPDLIEIEKDQEHFAACPYCNEYDSILESKKSF